MVDPAYCFGLIHGLRLKFINLVSLSALKNLYVWSSSSPASHQAQVRETQTGRKTRYGKISGRGWAIFAGVNFFSHLKALLAIVLVGTLLCKMFFFSQTRDLVSGKHLLDFFPHSSPCTMFFFLSAASPVQ